MADKSMQMILDALGKAAAGGAPLHGGKGAVGLFPTSAAGKQAAARCQEEGYLCPLPDASATPNPQGKKKSLPPSWCLTEKGLAHLLCQVSPREVLNDLVRALEGREHQIKELVAAANQAGEQLAGLRSVTETVLRQIVPVEALDGATGGLNVLFQAFLQRRGENGHAATNGHAQKRKIPLRGKRRRPPVPRRLPGNSFSGKSPAPRRIARCRNFTARRAATWRS